MMHCGYYRIMLAKDGHCGTEVRNVMTDGNEFIERYVNKRLCYCRGTARGTCEGFRDEEAPIAVS